MLNKNICTVINTCGLYKFFVLSFINLPIYIYVILIYSRHSDPYSNISFYRDLQFNMLAFM